MSPDLSIELLTKQPGNESRCDSDKGVITTYTMTRAYDIL